MIEISVVIPTCDRSDLLLEAVNCALLQSYPAHEVIVVNNGSQPLGNSFLPHKIRVSELPPYVGVSHARNTGTMLATSPYIAFLDDDDLWELDYLKKAAMVIEQFHPDCIIARMDKMANGRVSPFKNSAGRLDLATLLVENPGIGGQTTIVRRESFLLVSGYDTDLKTGEDKALIIELLLNGCLVMSAPNIQAIVREHAGSHLGDADSIHEGIAGFLKKYAPLMSPPQRNFNLLKVFYYRYLAEKKLPDYFRFWFHSLWDSYYRRRNLPLPEAPKLPLLNPLRIRR